MRAGFGYGRALGVIDGKEYVRCCAEIRESGLEGESVGSQGEEVRHRWAEKDDGGSRILREYFVLKPFFPPSDDLETISEAESLWQGKKRTVSVNQSFLIVSTSSFMTRYSQHCA